MSEEAAKTPLGELWAGLSQPSGAALAVSLSVPLVALALCALLITPEVIASEQHRYFARDPVDSDLFLTARVAALGAASPRRPVVAVLGGSAVLEALTSAEHLERGIDQAGSVDVDVWNLASWGQTLHATLAIVERFPERLEGVVVVGLTPFAMALGPAIRVTDGVFTGEEPETSLGLAVDGRSGNYFWSNRDFFLPRLPYLVRNLWVGPVTTVKHPFVSKPGPMPEADWHRLGPHYRERMEHGYEGNAPACREALVQIARQARRRGRVELVLLESPIAPLAISEVLGEAFWAEHRSTMAAFAESEGLHYWYLQDEARIGGDAFYDMQHLYRWQAMKRHTQVLAVRIAELLRGRGAEL